MVQIQAAARSLCVRSTVQDLNASAGGTMQRILCLAWKGRWHGTVPESGEHRPHGSHEVSPWSFQSGSGPALTRLHANSLRDSARAMASEPRTDSSTGHRGSAVVRMLQDQRCSDHSHGPERLSGQDVADRQPSVAEECCERVLCEHRDVHMERSASGKNHSCVLRSASGDPQGEDAPRRDLHTQPTAIDHGLFTEAPSQEIHAFSGCDALGHAHAQ